MGEDIATKCEGEKSSDCHGGFHVRNTNHQPPSSSASIIPKLQHATFICGHPGDVAKFETTKKSIRNYVVKTYDIVIVLAEGMCVGKSPITVLPLPHKKTKKSKSKLAGSELSMAEQGGSMGGEDGDLDDDLVVYKYGILMHTWKDECRKYSKNKRSIKESSKELFFSYSKTKALPNS